MSGNGCSFWAQNVSPETSWPISSEAPAGMDGMSWSSECVWDAMSFPQGVLQVSAPVEIRNPNNTVIFSIVIIGQSSGSPQLAIVFSGANCPEGPYTTLSGPTNITTLGLQFLGAVTGIRFPYVRAEVMSSNGSAVAGSGCFCVSEA
ncbi:MAG: hypothetical protein AAB074_15680 [Planctomycetota bacterium]